VSQDPVRELFNQFQAFRPRPVSVAVEQDRGELNVIYENGMSAQFRFVKEASGWKFDLSHHLGPATRLLGDTLVIKQAHSTFKAMARP
jgi:hypothetical protein